ncbi:hypothetical protein D910_06038 [Dendroctonus ponderosae]|uniref:Uncharacterized protein n=1 Tax=Dendroctonus ponderosae TaxID=77166 RepID=U4U428_DENPD|nr:hypothetical protein D910_06038 [Dendroctonus ponderosae]
MTSTGQFSVKSSDLMHRISPGRLADFMALFPISRLRVTRRLIDVIDSIDVPFPRRIASIERMYHILRDEGTREKDFGRVRHVLHQVESARLASESLSWQNTPKTANICDIAGSSHEYVSTSNIASVPCRLHALAVCL